MSIVRLVVKYQSIVLAFLKHCRLRFPVEDLPVDRPAIEPSGSAIDLAESVWLNCNEPPDPAAATDKVTGFARDSRERQGHKFRQFTGRPAYRQGDILLIADPVSHGGAQRDSRKVG